MKARILLIILLLTYSFTFAQELVADKFFENFAYIKASELYTEAYNKGNDSEHVLTRLADCYYNNSDIEKAAAWYKLAYEKYPRLSKNYVYKYIQTQRSLGNYDLAKTLLEKLNDPKLGTGEDFDKLISQEDVYVVVENLDINSELSDFGSFQYDDKIIFASSRKLNSENEEEAKKGKKGKKRKKGKKEKVYGWNKEPFLDLYEVSVNEKNGAKVYDGVSLINAEEINTEFHEASIAITKDGKTLYFTRDNITKRKRLSFDKEGTTHLKLYKATLQNDKWSQIMELPFNGKLFSTGHPALSVDEKKLYFVSDREGGFGETDIYVVDILENNKYGDPKNLGKNINTNGREMFPYVAKDSTFYFSSDKLINIGLLDIFKSNILKDKKSQPENLGAPYNSGYDDFAYFVDPKKQEGYFSSNRPGGKGSDDIYSFNAFQCKQQIKGFVKDIKTEDIIAGATVQLIDDTGKIIATTTSSDAGDYIFEDVDCDKKYSILAKKDDYRDEIKKLTTSSEHEKENEVEFFLFNLLDPCEIVINEILFDFNKANIRTDSKVELEYIVDVIKNHPGLIIKIEAHTDSRGSSKYNLKLSNKRAMATYDYLISRNVSPSSMESAIGYGETKLVNECDNGIKCSDEKHQENRRSHFYIVDCGQF